MKRIALSFGIAIFFLVGVAGAKTTIRWWQFWTDPDVKPVIQQMITEFEKAHPDIDVELTDLTWSNGHEKIVIAFSSGTGPDVVELGSDWIAEFAVNGRIADVSRDIAKDSADFDGWGMATWQGKVYAYPWILGTRVLFGNRAVMRRAGMRNPNWIPRNLTDLFMVASRVSKLDKNTYGWGSNAPEKHRLYKKFLPFFWSHGARIFTEDNKYCVISSKQAVDALTVYRLFHDSCGFVGTQREIEDAFLDGKIAFILSGDWLLKRIAKEKRKVDLAAYLFPGPHNIGKSFMGGEFLAINAASKHKKEAQAFIRFITSPENQLRFCKASFASNPSSKKTQADPYFTSDPIRDIFIRQLRASEHPPVDPDWVYIEDEIEKAVENVIFHGGLPGMSLRDAQIAITRIHRHDTETK